MSAVTEGRRASAADMEKERAGAAVAEKGRMRGPEIVVVLHNIRSVYNVGAILRTLDGLGVGPAVFSGYTPRFHDMAALPHLREKLDRQIQKSALGAEESVEQLVVADLKNWLRERRAEGWKIIGLENNLAPEEQARRQILGERVETAERIVLVLGEEVQGIPRELRGLMDEFLEIPMQGRKESFNVSVAAGIALWALSTRARSGLASN